MHYTQCELKHETEPHVVNGSASKASILERFDRVAGMLLALAREFGIEQYNVEFIPVALQDRLAAAERMVKTVQVVASVENPDTGSYKYPENWSTDVPIYIHEIREARAALAEWEKTK